MATYFPDGLDGKLKNMPRKEKRKIMILQHLIGFFDPELSYSEKEVNERLSHIFDDHVTLRRYLIQYGFMERNRDGSGYWVKK